MAENVLDIDVSQLAGGEIVNDIILEENKNESPKLQTENTNDIVDIDVSQLSGGEINEDVNNKNISSSDNQYDFDVSLLQGGENFETGQTYTAPTNLEKLEYGWDKETMVLGNIFRIGKAKAQDLFDDDKTFKDYILENEKKRIEKLNKEHWKFQGKEASSGLVTAGSVASMLLDPYYLAGYLNPISLKAMTNPVSAAVLNGLLVGGDVVIDNIAKTGEVDWNSVAVSSGTAGAIGAVIPIGGKVLSKYAPKLIKSEVELVKKFIDNKLAKQNNLSTTQLKKIQLAANSPEVKKASTEMIKWTNNFVRPIANETGKFKALEKTLLDKRDLLIKIRKLKGRKKPKPNVPGMLPQLSPGKQIINIRNEIIEAKQAMEAAKKILIEKQGKKLAKWGELTANRNIKILEALKKNETKIDWAFRGLLSATIRPMVGAGAGTVGGILFGDEETDLMYWAATGAMVGQMQKMVQRSSKFGTQLEKGKILGLLDREMVQLTMQKVRDLTSGTSASKLNSYGGATEKISNDSGFYSKKEIADYFPRLLDYDVIKKDEKAFLKTVQGIYESLGMKGKVTRKFMKDGITKNPNYNKLRSEVAAENYYKGHTTSGDTVLNSSILKDIMDGKELTKRNFIKTPVSDHIDKERALVGPYKLVEEVLEKKGYLVNDARSILSNVVNDSVKYVRKSYYIIFR